jgi:hypothetical protein
MSNTEDTGFEDMEIAVELRPADAAAAELVRQTFADEEILESNAFTGAEILTIIFSAAKGTIGKVLEFFVKHRESFKGASLKIGPKEVALTGLTKQEMEDILASGNIEKILAEMRKRK